MVWGLCWWRRRRRRRSVTWHHTPTSWVMSHHGESFILTYCVSIPHRKHCAYIMTPHHLFWHIYASCGMFTVMQWRCKWGTLWIENVISQLIRYLLGIQLHELSEVKTFYLTMKLLSRKNFSFHLWYHQRLLQIEWAFMGYRLQRLCTKISWLI